MSFLDYEFYSSAPDLPDIYNISERCIELLSVMRDSVYRRDWQRLSSLLEISESLGNSFYRDLLEFSSQISQLEYQEWMCAAGSDLARSAFVTMAEDEPHVLRNYIETVSDEQETQFGTRSFLESILAQDPIPSDNNFPYEFLFKHAEYIRPVIDIVIKLLGYSLQCKVHLACNEFNAENTDFDTQDSTELAGHIEIQSENLKQLCQSLYQGILDDDYSEFPAAMYSITQLSQASAVEFAQRLSMGNEVALQTRLAGKNTEYEKQAVVLAAGNDKLREQICAYYSTLWFQFYYTIRNNDSIAELFEELEGCEFDYSLPDGVNTEIHRFEDAQEGTYVQLSGIVLGSVSSRQSDGKLVTRLSLYDPSSKAKVDCIAIYAHLRHIGIARGSFMTVHGTKHSAYSLNSGNPALQIDRLSMNELKASSWFARFLSIKDNFYSRWPANLNLQVSLSKHETVADGLEHQGAAELVYHSFMD